MAGLLSDLPDKNCWTIAEHAGHDSPYGLQNLLSRGSWDHDGVRDDVRDYVIERLGDPDAILVADETGDLKKGTATVGVQREYTGTAGRVENAHVTVHMTCASRRGHAFIDAELYLPRSWTEYPERMAAAGVPGEVSFATKPDLAQRMIIRALDVGTPASWVAGDEVYGASTALRQVLEDRQVGYVLAAGFDHRVATLVGACVRTRSLPRCPAMPGSGTPLATEPRALAGTTGPSSTSPTINKGIGGCSSAATPAPVNWPTTAGTRPPQDHYRRWSPSPDGAGRWRNPSNPARACAASTSTKSEPGPPGGAGPSCPFSPSPSSPPKPPTNDQPRHHPA